MPVAERAKGQRARQEILEAALRITIREGIGGLTQRAVAAEAGVPLASTTYYFASKRDLLRETLRFAAAREVEQAESSATWRAAKKARTPTALARALAADTAAYVRDHREATAQYDVFLAAARDPDLADAAEAWTQVNVEMLAPVLARLGSADPLLDARAVNALVDGLAMEQLAGAGDDFLGTVARPVLERTLKALLAPRRRGDTR